MTLVFSLRTRVKKQQNLYLDQNQFFKRLAQYVMKFRFSKQLSVWLGQLAESLLHFSMVLISCVGIVIMMYRFGYRTWLAI